MSFRDDLHTLKHDEFVSVCRCLGYDPAQVVAVRLTRHRVFVTANDDLGRLSTIEHQVVQ